MRSLRILRDVAVPAVDGTQLRQDVFLPDTAEPVACLLQRTPYGKSNRATTEALLDVLSLVDRGLAVVVQDVRGRFRSDGRFVPFADESSDTRTTIDWIRAQPWSSGRVAMFGNSYMGLLQWQAAAVPDSGLVGIMPGVTSTSIAADWLAPGGVPADGFLATWLALTLYAEEARRGHRPGIGPDLPAPGRLIDGVIDFRPEAIAAMYGALERLNPDLWTAVTGPAPLLEPSTTAVDEQVAILSVAGTYDIFVRGSIADFSAASAPNSHQVIGPWAHGNYSGFFPDRSFGTGASFASWSATQPFLEAYLEGVMGGRSTFSSRYSFFLEGPNIWETTDSWPPPSTTPVEWRLGSMDGSLVLIDREAVDMPPTADSRTLELVLVRESAAAARSYGGATFLPGLGVSALSGPRELPGRIGPHGLEFVSVPVTTPTDILGSPVAELDLHAPAGTVVYGTIFHVPSGDERRFLLSSAKRMTAPTDVDGTSIVRLDFSPVARRLNTGDRVGLVVQLGAYPEVLESSEGAAARLIIGPGSGSALRIGVRSES